jgi:adenylate kinase family enzyme
MGCAGGGATPDPASVRLVGVQRVAVVGSGGVGKSTFAAELGRRSGIPVVHLDSHFWKPGWVEIPREEWVAQQVELFSGETWIADGNYGGTLDIRFSRADTVIVLSLPRWRCVLRALQRSLRHRGEEVQAAGCPERLDAKFLRWVWRYPIDSRPRLDAAIDRHRERLSVVELVSAAQARAFLDTLG